MEAYIFDPVTPVPCGLPGLQHATIAGSEHGLHQLSVWRQSIAPGAATPPHRHDCDEVVVCLAGGGTLLIDGAAHRFVAGQTMVLPAAIDHQIVNDGQEALETVAALAAAPVEVCLPDGTPLQLPWQT